MSQETLEFDGTLIPLEIISGKTFLQVKSAGAAIDVALSMSPKDYPGLITQGRYTYAPADALVCRLKKVSKKKSQQSAYELVSLLESEYLHNDEEFKYPVPSSGVVDIRFSISVHADPVQRHKEKLQLQMIQKACEKKLAMLQLAEEIEKGDFE